MARAATGLTEVACWQFIGAGIGGVAALMFFLILGAMNGMEPQPKTAEKVAPRQQFVLGREVRFGIRLEPESGAAFGLNLELNLELV